MKMHRILAEAAAAIAKSVFKDHKVLDHAVSAAFEENPKWGRRDRSFIAETVFEVVRWRRALSFVADSEETKALCAAQWLRMGYAIPEWWTFKGAAPVDMTARDAGLASQARAVRESIPDWLDEMGFSELGTAWDSELHALNQRAPVYLRVNTLRQSREKAIDWLAGHQVDARPVEALPDALVLAPGKSLPKPLRFEGRVEIQDAGSQIIAPLLGALPGERVIDACSGAGGKALHLAALMNDEGRIHALDVESRKLQELQKRAKRARATCIRTGLIDDAALRDLAGKADRLLIDAPCSGLGTLRRQPDLKWRLKPAQMVRVRSIQKDLLDRYPAMLAPGGTLVYATCSILPSENVEPVRALLESGKFRLVSHHPVSPAATGFDGFHAAVLEKC